MWESLANLFPEQASTVAGRVDALYFFLIAVSVFFGVLIAAVLVVFAIRFRRRLGGDEPAQIHGSLGLELLWTMIPFVLVMVMFAWGASVFASLRRPPDDALQMFVVGKQWMWKVQHLEGRREINEMHVPVGRAVRLLLTSEDVIHSFYVPAFRVKQDAVPGLYTTLWFEATKPGRYHLFCAEYCGTEHSRMIGSVIVMEPAQYQAWLTGDGTGDGAAPPTLAEQGEALFDDLGCRPCHSGQSGTRGPNLAGVFGAAVRMADGRELVADEAYLRESILNPQARVVAGYEPVMPTFAGVITEEQILQLIAYIRTLGEGGS